jgi:hypothetical protein
MIINDASMIYFLLHDMITYCYYDYNMHAYNNRQRGIDAMNLFRSRGGANPHIASYYIFIIYIIIYYYDNYI